VTDYQYTSVRFIKLSNRIESNRIILPRIGMLYSVADRLLPYRNSVFHNECHAHSCAGPFGLCMGRNQDLDVNWRNLDRLCQLSLENLGHILKAILD